MTFFSVWVLTQSPLKFVMECSDIHWLFFCVALAGGTCPLASFSPPTSTDLTPFLLLIYRWTTRMRQPRLPFGDMRLTTFLVWMGIVWSIDDFFRPSWKDVSFPTDHFFPCSFIHCIRQPRLPFCDMRLTFFCVSTASGLLHDVFQYVSAHSYPHWNLLWNAQPRLPFGDMRLTFFCVSPLLPLHTTFFSGWVFTPIPIAICCALPSVRQHTSAYVSIRQHE
jgi:hypothetical protein